MTPLNLHDMLGFSEARQLCEEVVHQLGFNTRPISELSLRVFNAPNSWTTFSINIQDFCIWIPSRILSCCSQDALPPFGLCSQQVREFIDRVPNTPDEITEQVNQLSPDELQRHLAMAYTVSNIFLPKHIIKGILAHEVGHMLYTPSALETVHRALFYDYLLVTLIVGGIMLPMLALFLDWYFLSELIATIYLCTFTIGMITFDSHCMGQHRRREYLADNYASRVPELGEGLRDHLKILLYQKKLRDRVHTPEPCENFRFLSQYIYMLIFEYPLNTHPPLEARITNLNARLTHPLT